MAKVDLAKRRRIMQRSQALGHCICDPKRPCPCDVFTGRGICPCAGERPDPVDLAQVRLTQLVHNTGCASKIAPADLEQVLSRLPVPSDPAVISGVLAGDDAGIYALTDGVTLVQTVDVLTPVADEPRTFGRICAANCLSDVYAMGGVPRTALSILAFPSETHDGRIMYEMLNGALEVLKEAGVALIGGHSIKDEEIKLGFAVTGTVERAQATRHDTARVGDVLVLTKPLGVGVLAFGRQVGRVAPEHLAAAERSMAELNKAAAEAAREAGVSACTDVTGFGLFGHLISMARHSQVTAQVYADALPVLPGALEALRAGVIPGAVERNREYVGEDIACTDGVEEARFLLGFDAQTSGGLLLAVPAGRRGRLTDALARRGVRGAVIGKVVARSPGRIEVTLSGQDVPAAAQAGRAAEGSEQAVTDERQPVAAPAPDGPAEPCCSHEAGKTPAPLPASAPAKGEHEECCAEAFGKSGRRSAGGPARASTADETATAYREMMRAAGADGAVDAQTKQLINFALVLQARCAPCFRAHYARSRQMGITQDQLDEAAWCAATMGGAPVWMFYQDMLQQEQAK